jgi:hypothetical protein
VAEEIKKNLSELVVTLRDTNWVFLHTKLEHHQHVTLPGILNFNQVVHTVTRVLWNLNSTYTLYVIKRYPSWLRLTVRSCSNFPPQYVLVSEQMARSQGVAHTDVPHYQCLWDDDLCRNVGKIRIYKQSVVF